MEINFNEFYYYFNMFLFFDFILYVNIQYFMIRKLILSTWVIDTTLLDYHSNESIWEAHIWISMIG
jgi:hypothetical protein